MRQRDIFPKRHVKDIMQRVFYPPMRTARCGKYLRVGGKTGHIQPPFMGYLVPTLPGRVNNPDGLDTLPERVPFHKPGYIPGNPVKPLLKPSVIHFKGGMLADIRVSMGTVKVFKRGFHILIEGSLVLFQGKQILSLCGNNPVGYFILASLGLLVRSVYGYDAPFEGY
jgi:hypothetical protein